MRINSFSIFSVSSLYDIAVDLQKAGKIHEALENYYKIVALKPDHYYALNNIGCALDDIGDQEQALIYLKRAIKLQPDNCMAYYNCGYIYNYKQRAYHLAIQNYTKVIELSPQYIQAYIDRSTCYESLGEYKRAMADIQKAVNLKYGKYKLKEPVTIVRHSEQYKARETGSREPVLKIV
jgi:tetratricopeptide (TPR) repeat protein